MTHPFKNKFSFPFNTLEIIKLYNEDSNLLWFKEHSEIINEVYIDPIIFGFSHNDMNGRSYDYNDNDIVFTILKIIKSYDIKISIVMNNIFEEDLDLECVNKLITYSDLVDILVLPNEVHIEELKNHFYVKNTVIRDPKVDEVMNGDYDDYDMIYIHDSIIQNLDIYTEMKKVKNLTLGVVVNFEMCYADCPHKRKHYKYISRKQDVEVDFCKPTRMGKMERLLKISSIPPLYREYEKYIDVIDCFKLQGRNPSTGNFGSAINIIEMIFNQEKTLQFDTDRFPDYKFLNIIPLRIMNGWTKTKLNCGGLCDSCNYCDGIVEEYNLI